VRHSALFEGDHRRHRMGRITPQRLISYNARTGACAEHKRKAAAPFGTAASFRE
jgi:hypothetical protein